MKIIYSVDLVDPVILSKISRFTQTIRYRANNRIIILSLIILPVIILPIWMIIYEYSQNFLTITNFIFLDIDKNGVYIVRKIYYF